MEDLNDLFKEAIQEAKKIPETKKETKKRKAEENKDNCAFISINSKNKYPLYTVRIPRDLAKECEINKGDKMCFHLENDEQGNKTIKAELKRRS